MISPFASDVKAFVLSHLPKEYLGGGEGEPYYTYFNLGEK